jgi:hypothetical protein
VKFKTFTKAWGHLVTQETHPCGRLVPTADFDSQTEIATFCVPSNTRKDRVYAVEVDFKSCEVGCKCEALNEYDFREAHRMPYNRNKGGTYLEHLARTRGYKMNPLITRQPRFLCPHAKKVQLWLRRHGFAGHFKAREDKLIARFTAMEKAA